MIVHKRLKSTAFKACIWLVFGIHAGQAASLHDGQWIGSFAVDPGSIRSCVIAGEIRRAEVVDGHLTLTIKDQREEISVQGAIDENGKFAEWQSMSFLFMDNFVTRREDFKFQGRFKGDEFKGHFYGSWGQVTGFVCEGEIRLARKGTVLAEALSSGRDKKVIALERRLAARLTAVADRGDAELRGEIAQLAEQLTTERARLAKLRAERRRETARLAELKRQIGQVTARVGRPAAPAATGDIKFGAYHALVIGIDAYKSLSPLRTATNDAREIGRMLADNYGFQVTQLINPTRADIIDRLDQLRDRLGRDDNLIIYYAGHGWLDKGSGRRLLAALESPAHAALAMAFQRHHHRCGAGHESQAHHGNRR